MERAIIISKNMKASEYFEKFLIAHKIRDITIVSSSARARRAVSEHSFDIAIIVAPLTEETGTALAKELASISETQVLFFGKDDLLSAWDNELLRAGVITQSVPINKVGLEHHFALAMGYLAKIKRVLSQTQDLQSKLREIKKIDLAKCYLIEMEQKSEEEAHKLIEKLAMDKRKTKLQVALEIIDKYRCN